MLLQPSKEQKQREKVQRDMKNDRWEEIKPRYNGYDKQQEEKQCSFSSECEVLRV